MATNVLASVAASGGPNCHFESADSPCGFPAPGAEIFQFDSVLTFQFGSIDFNITKVTFVVILTRCSFFNRIVETTSNQNHLEMLPLTFLSTLLR